MRRLPSSLLLALLVTACSGDDNAAANAAATGGAAGGTVAGARGATPAADTAALGLAFALPRLVAAGVQSSRSMVAEAVYFASAQSGAALAGQATKTGTITVSPAGYQYAPAPADKLVVSAGDQVHEFESIDEVGNNMADTAITWLQSPHRLAYVHRMPGKAEARIEEQFDGQAFESRVTGWSVLGGKRYEVALSARGGGQGNSGNDGAESQTRYELTGTVRGEGVEVDVQEQHFFNYASAVSLRLLYSQRGWASQFRARVGSTVRCGGATYRFADVQVETGAKEKGGQRTDDVVSTSGAILRDERPFAEVALQNGIAVAKAGGAAFPLQLPAN